METYSWILAMNYQIDGIYYFETTTLCEETMRVCMCVCVWGGGGVGLCIVFLMSRLISRHPVRNASANISSRGQVMFTRWAWESI